MHDNFISGLDIQQPDWWIVFATQQDLIDCVRLCTDGHSGTVMAKVQLKQRTADRLITAIRGGIEGGLVIPCT